MAGVANVVSFIQHRVPAASGMKLHKLLYYAQAWSLVWDDDPLFHEDFQAWREGPVLPSVFSGKPTAGAALTKKNEATLEAVLQLYGSRSGEWLSRLTHREPPWRLARRGLSRTAKSKVKVRQADMLHFYGKTEWGEGKRFSDAYRRGLDILVELPEDEVELLMLPARPADGRGHVEWLEAGDEP